MASSAMKQQLTTTLVLGATGATGRWVVQHLLDQNLPVLVMVRSSSSSSCGSPADRMLEVLQTTICPQTLTIQQGMILDRSDNELRELLTKHNVGTIVSCLGHNMTFQGIWGRPRFLVRDSIVRLVNVGRPGTKFILMSSDGVFCPAIDDRRTMVERILFCLIRSLLPPHTDNEAAAAFLQDQMIHDHWVIVRPTNLTNDGNTSSTTTSPSSSTYQLLDKPPPGGVLLGNNHNSVSRINVAKFMVDLLTNETLFDKYKRRFPVIHDCGGTTNNKTDGSQSPEHRNTKEKTL